MQNETLDLLYSRKSTRAFVGDIPEEDVQRILRAALEAPSAGNMTLWSGIRVTDPTMKARFAEICDHQPFIATAPLVIVFCADYKRWYDVYSTLDLGEEIRRPGEGDLLLSTVDTVIAAHASTIAAEALGYGSCYIGDILENIELLREMLHLPPYVKPVCMAVYGAPTEGQRKRKKPSRFAPEDVFFENAYPDRDANDMKRMLSAREGKDGAELEPWIAAHCRRKWNCDFSREMTRSSGELIDEWRRGE